MKENVPQNINPEDDREIKGAINNVYEEA